MRDAKEIPLAHRGLAAFADPVAEPIAPLLDAYRGACRAGLDAMAEKLDLDEELHELEGDDGVDAGRVLVFLRRRREIHMRLEELAQIISDAGEKERTAVEIAEAHRASRAGLFSMHGERPLSATRTLYAIREGTRDVTELETPLTDADRARIRRRGRG